MRERLGPVLVVLLSAAMVAGSALLLAGPLDAHGPLEGGLVIPVLVVAALFALAEAFVLHVHVGREAHSFSLSEIPLVLGLVALAPAELVGARLLGALVALVIVRRQQPIKLLFNVSYFALDAAIAAVVFRAVLGDASPVGGQAWMAAFAATTVGLVVGAIAITLAISAREGRMERPVLGYIAGLGVLTTIISTNVALVAVVVLSATAAGAWLLAMTAVAVVLVYTAHDRLREGHRDLQRLYEFTRSVGGDLDPSLTRSLLHQARTVLRADVAELTLVARDGEPWRRYVLDTEEDVRFEDDYATVTCRRHSLLDGSPSILLARSPRNHELLRQLGAGVEDAVVAALTGPEGPIGTLMVANRLGDTTTFDEADARLLETLANHASVSLRNSHLVGQLRREAHERHHQALHDALTGLPNRMLFDSRVRAALADGVYPLAVMLIDLDRFKEVNDTLGHHHGDGLLAIVARRLEEAVGDLGDVARLGGDEFGVLLPGYESKADVLDVARRIVATMSDGFSLADLVLDVGASIGIALAPDDATEAPMLLQRADVAMYAAKSSASSIEFYDPKQDHHSPARLVLATELRRTLEREELLVQFQPIAELATGRVVRVEALARWHHPRRGFVPADQFIPLAEKSGQIQLLTDRVLSEALRQCRLLRAEGYDLGVSVNVSVRSLLDDRLVEDVARHLAAQGLPPDVLTLEITESMIMAEPARTIAVLKLLSAMGVSLAIDDFGTGYSSLSHLKRLPVDELKIDKSFVMGMGLDDNDATIVRSIVDLGRNLGLQVVAEGVEDQKAWARLSQLGCTYAQGFILSRPATAHQLSAFLRSQAPALEVVPG